MRIHVIDELPYERELVFSTHRDRLRELVPYLRGVDRIDVSERQIDGSVVRFENVWYGTSNDVPAVIRPILKPELLRWIDRAAWDQDAWRCDWEIELTALPDAVTARGTSRFRDEGAETVVEITGEFSINPDRIPGVPAFAARRAQPTIERFVVGLLEPNLTEANRAVEQYIEDHLL